MAGFQKESMKTICISQAQGILPPFSLAQMLDFYKDKYADGIPFTTLKSLTWFEDAEDDPMPTMLRDYSWEKVKDRISAEVCQLV